MKFRAFSTNGVENLTMPSLAPYMEQANLSLLKIKRKFMKE